MDFAIRQMKNMGWSEGKGLGVKEDGIVNPIKPYVQTDTRGLGFSISDSLQIKNQWWAEAYNTARNGKQIDYKITSVGVIVKSKKRKDCDQQEDEEDKPTIFGDRFVSGGIMETNNNEDQDSQIEDNSNNKIKKKKKKNKKNKSNSEKCLENNSVEEQQEENECKKSLDFNEIFAKNKGQVTCHKAARLGIKMSGKLKRLQEQEQQFLKKKQN